MRRQSSVTPVYTGGDLIWPICSSIKHTKNTEKCSNWVKKGNLASGVLVKCFHGTRPFFYLLLMWCWETLISTFTGVLNEHTAKPKCLSNFPLASGLGLQCQSCAHLRQTSATFAVRLGYSWVGVGLLTQFLPDLGLLVERRGPGQNGEKHTGSDLAQWVGWEVGVSARFSAAVLRMGLSQPCLPDCLCAHCPVVC